LGVLEQFPRTGAGHPDSRFRDSPRILEPGQISRSRYRRAESKLRASPCNLEIGRQNTDSKFRGSCFCLRSCTVPSSITSPSSLGTSASTTSFNTASATPYIQRTAQSVPINTTDGLSSTRLHLPATIASERSLSITSPSSLGTPGFGHFVQHGFGHPFSTGFGHSVRLLHRLDSPAILCYYRKRAWFGVMSETDPPPPVV